MQIKDKISNYVNIPMIMPVLVMLFVTACVFEATMPA